MAVKSMTSTISKTKMPHYQLVQLLVRNMFMVFFPIKACPNTLKVLNSCVKSQNRWVTGAY